MVIFKRLILSILVCFCLVNTAIGLRPGITITLSNPKTLDQMVYSERNYYLRNNITVSTTLPPTPDYVIVTKQQIQELNTLRPKTESILYQRAWWQGIDDCKKTLNIPKPKFFEGPSLKNLNVWETILYKQYPITNGYITINMKDGEYELLRDNRTIKLENLTGITIKLKV